MILCLTYLCLTLNCYYSSLYKVTRSFHMSKHAMYVICLFFLLFDYAKGVKHTLAGSKLYLLLM